MIKRIVKMKFKKECITPFKNLFEEVKPKIASSEGCTHLELVQDIHDPSIIFTISMWKDERNLNEYRSSMLFTHTWSITKTYFDDRPEAWSTKQISIATEKKNQ